MASGPDSSNIPTTAPIARPISRWKDKWALVTGASAGIGWALAQQLAAGGANLVLTARRVDRLQKLAADLTVRHGIQAEVFAADLARPETPAAIHAFTEGQRLEIGLLVNNAGFGVFGYTQEIDASRLMDMIQLNCSAVVRLTRIYLPRMVERRAGDILIVASTAAFQPVPFIAAYAATKAFDLIFAEGLAEEVRGFGVRVCALCPGSTNTEFQQVAHQPDRAFRFAETAEKVARVGLEGLAQGKSSVISGRRNRWMVFGERFAPRAFVAKMAAKVMGPESAKQ